jgi:hypothetical protein
MVTATRTASRGEVMAQHKWHKEIKAWADGAEIEANYYEKNRGYSGWQTDDNPDWHDPDNEYRIKPQPKEPQYLYVYQDSYGVIEFQQGAILGYYKTYIGKIKLEVDDVGAT